MSTVLDAGCGTGRVGVELAATGWDGTLVGVDLSAGMLAVAAETAYYERWCRHRSPNSRSKTGPST